MTAVTAVLLAAGRSTRMGADNKLLATYQDRPLVVHALASALAAPVDEVVLVTGHQGAQVAAAVAAGIAAGDVPGAAGRLRVVHNPRFSEGLATSLQTGTSAVSPGAEAVLVMLGDMPLVTPGLVTKLVDAWRAHPAAAAVVPVVDGRRGNPVVLARKLLSALAGLSGDEGARRLLGGRDDVIEIAVADDGAAVDIDTPEALRELLDRRPG